MRALAIFSPRSGWSRFRATEGSQGSRCTTALPAPRVVVKKSSFRNEFGGTDVLDTAVAFGTAVNAVHHKSPTPATI